MKNAFALSALALFLTVGASAQTVTPIPPLMNFQGRFAKIDGTPAPNGTYNITLGIYNDPNAITPASLLWQEYEAGIMLNNGVFSVVLGGTTPLTDSIFNGTVYLDISIVGANGGVSLRTRQKLLSSAYAFKANTVPDGAITTAKIADGSITAAKLASGAALANGPAGGDLTGAFPNPMIASGAITSGKLADGSVLTMKLADGSVTTAKLADGSVTSNKIVSLDFAKLFNVPPTRLLLPYADSVDSVAPAFYITNPSGRAIYGYSANNVGVIGISDNFFGVVGQSSLVAVQGNNTNGTYGYLGYTGIGAYGFSRGIGVQGNNADGSFGRLGAIGTGVYGNSTVNAGYFDGNVIVTGTFSNPSDVRYKTNIAPLGNALENVLALRGVTYAYDRDKFKTKNFPEGKQIGFIAQEVEKTFPELVLTDKEGYKSIDYTHFAPTFVEAIKAQEKKIDALENQVAELKKQADELKKQNLEMAEMKIQFAALTASLREMKAAQEKTKTAKK